MYNYKGNVEKKMVEKKLLKILSTFLGGKIKISDALSRQ